MCQYARIIIHKYQIAKEIAVRGKISKGWFFEFKLHGVCKRDRELENIFFTPGNLKDSRALYELIVNLEGIFVCYAGYLFKDKELERLFESEKRL